MAGVGQRYSTLNGSSYPTNPPLSPQYGSPGPSSPGSIRSGSSSTRDRHGCFSHVRMTAGAKISRYFQRIIHAKQMDFEYAGWQMLYLLAAPHKVYRTKDQWARDDPAFAVLMGLALFGSSVIFALIMRLSFFKFVQFLLWVIGIDFLGTGVVVASFLWLVSNNCMRVTNDHDVEWGYCWDVHLNSFFPLLVILHVIMPVCYPFLIIPKWFIVSVLIGNSFWFVAIAYYIYITFLGYTALGFLRHTQAFLYPITFLFIFIIAITTLSVDMSSYLISFYHFRLN